MAKKCGDLDGGSFVADLELAGGKLIFAVLVLRRDDAAAHGAVQMFAALSGVTAGLGMAPGAHHGYSDRSQRVAQRRALAGAEHDSDLWERAAQRAHQLNKFAIAHREERTKSASRRT